ncbi:phosphopantetheinyl transferase EntD [Candidatus Termititenax persephonae]|uniref:Holo-[acyl-carrier-protein] synthase n=1 Tax=Candidatus Termititenax persephonae TaxID=2218525 RepID=A0A388THT6_9BACT|nr:phosphopantetheinyl transferase EntD [Candidatus Termititenax persephonae]
MLGFDAVDIARVRKIVETEAGEAFLKKVFTERELAYCRRGGQRQYESLAARFAAKEAVGKALGVGIGLGTDLTGIEVLNDAKGKPSIVLHDRPLELAREKNIENFAVSLSHTETTAYAVCLAQGAEGK